MGLHLQGVAAIGVDPCLIRQDEHESVGAGEARQPGNALRIRWQILALMLVRAWNQEPIQTVFQHQGTQGG